MKRKSTAGIQCLLPSNRSCSFLVFHSGLFHRKQCQRLVFSWLVQRSQLPKDSPNLTVSEGYCSVIKTKNISLTRIIDLTFRLCIQPSADCLPNHALGAESLSIIFNEPVVTSRSPPEMSWPFSFVANRMSIPPEEAEKMFRVKINMTCLSTVYEMGPFPVNFIHDMCGFNPILDGADIRS